MVPRAALSNPQSIDVFFFLGDVDLATNPVAASLLPHGIVTHRNGLTERIASLVFLWRSSAASEDPRGETYGVVD